MAISQIGGLQYDTIRLTAYLGLAATGKTVNGKIQRVSDGFWWSGAVWQAGVTVLVLAQLDATNLPGLYEILLPAGAVDQDVAEEGYRYSITEATVPYDECGFLNMQTPQRVLAQPIPANIAADNLADILNRVNGTRHHNTRIVNTAWNAAKQPTAGFLLVYDSAVNLNADVSPWTLNIARYDFALTYDGSGNLTEYTSAKVL